MGTLSQKSYNILLITNGVKSELIHNYLHLYATILTLTLYQCQTNNPHSYMGPKCCPYQVSGV